MIKLYSIMLVCCIVLRCNVYSNSNLLNDILNDNKEYHEKVLEKEPNNVASLVGLSNALWGLGNIDKSLKLAKKAFEIDPNNQEVLINYSIILFTLREYDEFLKVLEKLKAVNPENPYIYYLSAKYYKTQGKQEEELNMLLKTYDCIKNKDVISYTPHLCATFYNGENFLLPSKIELEEMVLNKEPGYTNSTDDFYSTSSLTPEVYLKLEKFYEGLVKKYPQFSQLKIRYMALKNIKGEYQYNEKFLRDILRNDPENTQSIVCLAHLYFTQNKINDALKLLLDSEHLFEKNPIGYYELGRIYSSIGEKEKVIKYWGRFIEIIEGDEFQEYKYLREEALILKEKIKTLKANPEKKIERNE